MLLTVEQVIRFVLAHPARSYAAQVNSDVFQLNFLEDKFVVRIDVDVKAEFTIPIFRKYLDYYNQNQSATATAFRNEKLPLATWFLGIVSEIKYDPSDGWWRPTDLQSISQIEIELRRFLEKTTQRVSGDLRLRNIELIAYRFGLRGDAWADRVDAARAVGIPEKSERELPRQILAKYFEERVRLIDIPTVTAIAARLEVMRYVSAKTLFSSFRSEGYVDGCPGPKGMMNFFESMKLCKDFELVTSALNPATRAEVQAGAELFFIHRSEIHQIKGLLNRLRQQSGREGVVKCDAGLINSAERRLFLKELLEATPESWTYSNGDNDESYWFISSRKRNPLLNRLEKISAVLGAAILSQDELFESLRYSLRKRPPVPAQVIEAFLRKLPNVVMQGKGAIISQCKDSSDVVITSFEKDLLGFLVSAPAGSVSLGMILKELSRKHKESTVAQMVGSLPFVYVDRSTRPRTYGLLKRVEQHDVTSVGSSNVATETEIETDLRSILSVTETQRLELLLCRCGQGAFRRKLIKLRGHCYVTKIEDESLLRASHIKPWRDSDNLEKLDEHNGLLLTPLYDHLFDAGYISFEDDGTMLIAKELEPHLKRLGITKDFLREDFGEKTKRYLIHHRAKFYEHQDQFPEEFGIDDEDTAGP